MNCLAIVNFCTAIIEGLDLLLHMKSRLMIAQHFQPGIKWVMQSQALNLQVYECANTLRYMEHVERIATPARVL